MIIEGEDIDNPVLLFLHGGPGTPEYPLIEADNLRLDKYFTVCYWDQRGTGMSFSPKEKTLTLEQLVKDTLMVTKHLCKKFNKEKIYLFGHSWGTFLGIVTASKYPECFHAYLGAGQIGDTIESEKETLEFLKYEAEKRGHIKVQEKLQKMTLDQNLFKDKTYLKIRGKYLSEYGGGIKREGIAMRTLLKQYFSCDYYTFKEKLNIFRGTLRASKMMEILTKNSLIDLVPKLDIPIFIFQGKYDYLSTHNQAKFFFEELIAPKKHFYTFNHSAHSPFLEEKELFYNILAKDVLGNITKNPI